MPGSEYYDDDMFRNSASPDGPRLIPPMQKPNMTLVDAAKMILREQEQNANLDPNVVAVCDKYKERAEAGMLKYGTNTTRSDLNREEWLTHLQEELMDATIYIERLKKELKGV